MGTRTVLASGLLFVFCLLFPRAAIATTWHVPLDAPTIAAGIDSATAGDTVLVACGTYYEYQIVIKSGVKLLSETGLPDCVTIDAQSLGRVFYSSGTDAATLIRGFTATGGNAPQPNSGAGMYCTASNLRVEHCDFIDNHTTSHGGGAYVEYSDMTFDNCVFSANSGWSTASAVEFYYGAPTITDCSFTLNDAPVPSVDAALVLNRANATVSNVTVAFNTGADGILVYLGVVTVSNTISAFNSGGPGINGYLGTTPTIICTNSFGNSGGDWVGGASGQLGTNGNISLDPRFCDAGSGDYHLSSASPCLGQFSGCGDMGAYGRGCLDELPVFLSLDDVGNDQGRAVRLRWERSKWDAPGDTIDVESYEVYRYQGAFAASRPEPAGGPRRVEGWDYIASAPAHGDSIYQLVAPTLCDSTIASGQCWSLFFVRAVTTDRFTYFDSPVDSGYSVDNLAPGVPAAFTVAYGPAVGNALSWEAVPDADFQYYKVYRDTEAGFTPSPANLLHTTIDVAWLDAGRDHGHYYMVSAVDHAGNEGDATGPETVTGAQDEPMPKAYALYQNAPNPFNPVTTIRYDLPGASRVTLTIYDVSGRLVRALKRGDMEPAGRRSVVWDGTGNAGERVASGVYFYRLEAGFYTSTHRMVLIQ